jgi:hypothetical protein
MKLLTTIITIVTVYNYSNYIVELDVALLGKNGMVGTISSSPFGSFFFPKRFLNKVK